MDKRELRLDYHIYGKSLPEEYRKLCGEAMAAVSGAYSIYSGFSVGAAVLLDNEVIVRGSNQENVAYPSGLCAERVALFHAGASYPDVKVKAVAIAACQGGKPVQKYISPCGACRQVMAEVIRRYGEDFDVVMTGEEESVVVKASALLPFAFDF